MGGVGGNIGIKRVVQEKVTLMRVEIRMNSLSNLPETGFAFHGTGSTTNLLDSGQKQTN